MTVPAFFPPIPNFIHSHQALRPNRRHCNPSVPRRAPPTAITSFPTESHPFSTLQGKCPSLTNFHTLARELSESGTVSSNNIQILLNWAVTYRNAIQDNPHITDDPNIIAAKLFSTLLELSREATLQPIQFSVFHKSVRSPFDYNKLGINLFTPLINPDKSEFFGKENVQKIREQVRAGHNVIFLSNHQSESDGYIVTIMLNLFAGCDSQFTDNLIFMAGDRVRTDPTVSFLASGLNLLTVYSKRHINDIPELRDVKTAHNRQSVAYTQRLFKQGGSTLWFAPAGGRDRVKDTSGHVEVSKFDPGAVNMMRVMTANSGRPCHFYPMSLWTYDVMPPPSKVGGAAVGEQRIVNYVPNYVHVGEEIQWENAVVDGTKDRKELRKQYCNYAQELVEDGYRKIGGYERVPRKQSEDKVFDLARSQ